MIRFHTQTGGVTLQAQQPEVNIIRVALQGFAAVCGGTQSLHTNGFDEALALPTERSARIALRTQQVIAHESGAADTVDPFAGSYFVESLTDEIEKRSWELIEKVDELGGSVEALDFIQREIEESALSYHERYRTGPGHRRRRQQVRHRHGRRRRHPQGRPRGRAPPEGAPGEVQGQPRPGGGRREARGAARGRPRRRQPAAPDPRGAAPPTPRSARSATRCATSSASTRAARSSSRRQALANGRSAAGVGRRRPNPAHMESKAKRTLVKSAPELWELADDAERMQAWMRGLIGCGRRSTVEVTEREPERILAWRCAPDPDGPDRDRARRERLRHRGPDHRAALPPGPGRGDRCARGPAR